MRKVTRKGKINGFEVSYTWLCWEQFFSMFHICFMNKGISLNLDLMLSGNYVMIMLMFIYVYMYLCIYVVI